MNFSSFWPSFLNWNEIRDIKKRSLFNSTGSLRQFNGLYLSLGGHFVPLMTFGHSWLEMAPRERQKVYFIFLKPVTLNNFKKGLRRSLVTLLLTQFPNFKHCPECTAVYSYFVESPCMQKADFKFKIMKNYVFDIVWPMDQILS
mgnify:CR=1 FL=1